MAKKVIYHPGCVGRVFLKDIAKNYETILKKVGIDFLSMEDNKLLFCCGLPLLNSGYKDEFLKLIEENEERLKALSISKVITSCPGCFNSFSADYSAEIIPVTRVILENIRKFDKRGGNEKITYLQPCELRKANSDEPEIILKALGFGVEKIDDACCGAGGNLKFYSPRLANLIAKKLLSKVKTRKLVTACPMCYMHLKENAKDNGIMVMDLSEVLI